MNELSNIIGIAVVLAFICALAIYTIYSERRHKVLQKDAIDMLKVANHIVSEYAKVQQAYGNQMLKPLSKIPAEKNIIKSSILVVALYKLKYNELDDELYNAYNISYMQLASFVPDAVASETARFGDFLAGFNDIKNKSKEEIIKYIDDLGDVHWPQEAVMSYIDESARLSDEYRESIRKGKAEIKRKLGAV